LPNTGQSAERSARRWSLAGSGAFLAALVSALFFLFCFEELAQLMTLVTPNWQDAKLSRSIMDDRCASFDLAGDSL